VIENGDFFSAFGRCRLSLEPLEIRPKLTYKLTREIFNVDSNFGRDTVYADNNMWDSLERTYQITVGKCVRVHPLLSRFAENAERNVKSGADPGGAQGVRTPPPL